MAQGSAGRIRRLAFGQTILERAAKKESSLRSEGIAKPAKTGLWVDEVRATQRTCTQCLHSAAGSWNSRSLRKSWNYFPYVQ